MSVTVPTEERVIVLENQVAILEATVQELQNVISSPLTDEEKQAVLVVCAAIERLVGGTQ